jgi:hypothetical protein
MTLGALLTLRYGPRNGSAPVAARIRIEAEIP